MSETLFDKLYGATDEEVKASKKPLVMKNLKRKFYAAYDNAESQKVDAEAKINDLRTKFENIDINGILAAKDLVAKLNAMQSSIKQEFSALFGSEMRTTDD